MSRILTLTMNPALDVSSAVSSIHPSEKLRCKDVRHDAGGGGVNVARVLRRLDANTLAIFPVGGPIGDMFQQLVTAEGVHYRAIAITGQTREDFSVIDQKTGSQYRFVMPGPALSAAEVNKCLEAVETQLCEGDYLVASGSLPPGVPSDFYVRLGRLAMEASARFVLDTSGSALRAAIATHLFLIKPSKSELEQLVGATLTSAKDCLAAAKDIVAHGMVRFIAVSMGGEGAFLVSKESALRAHVPQIEARTEIGAGDSFLAAMVWAFSRAETEAEALRLACAAGSAALLGTGTGLCSVTDIYEQRQKIQVEAITNL